MTHAPASARRPRLGLYARNSKPPKGWRPSFEGEEPPSSWSVQLDQLRAWAEREGRDVVVVEYDVHASARDPNRPAWKRLMNQVRAHRVDEVAATRLDRVMRSTPHYYATAKEFLDLGVDLIFIEQGIRLSKRDPMNKFLMGSLAVAAELELDLARERTRAVMEVREDGRTYGPRSDQPAGRPREYGEGHKFRKRGGRLIHDANRCARCRGEKEGVEAEAKTEPENGGSPGRG